MNGESDRVGGGYSSNNDKANHWSSASGYAAGGVPGSRASFSAAPGIPGAGGPPGSGLYGDFIPQRSAPPPPGSLTGPSGVGTGGISGAKSGFVGRSASSVAASSSFTSNPRNQRSSYVSTAGSYRPGGASAGGLPTMQGDPFGGAGPSGGMRGVGLPGTYGNNTASPATGSGSGSSSTSSLPLPVLAGGSPALSGLNAPPPGGAAAMMTARSANASPLPPHQHPPKPVRSHTAGTEGLPSIRTAGLAPNPQSESLSAYGPGPQTTGLDFSDGPNAGMGPTGTFRARDPNRNTFKSVFGGFVNSMSGECQKELLAGARDSTLTVAAQTSFRNKRELRFRRHTIRSI